MALPSLTTHRKFRRLVRLLGEPEAHVRGYLETMWDKGYGDGDPHIGNDPLDVADACGHPGNPEAIAGALASCGGEGRPGFVDVADDGAYYIHNLNRHAPRYVRQRRATNLARDAGLGRLGMTSHQGRDMVLRLAASGHCDLDRPDLDELARMARGDFGAPELVAVALDDESGRPGAPGGAPGQQNAPDGASHPRPSHPSPSQPKAEASRECALEGGPEPERRPPPDVWADRVWAIVSSTIGRPRPSRRDSALLRRWYEDGLDAARLGELVVVVGTRPTDDPPSSLAYFEPIVAAELAAVDDKTGESLSIFDADAELVDADYRRYAAGSLVRNGSWLTDRQRLAVQSAMAIATTARALDLLSRYVNRTYNSRAAEA